MMMFVCPLLLQNPTRHIWIQICFPRDALRTKPASNTICQMQIKAGKNRGEVQQNMLQVIPPFGVCNSRVKKDAQFWNRFRIPKWKKIVSSTCARFFFLKKIFLVTLCVFPCFLSRAPLYTTFVFFIQEQNKKIEGPCGVSLHKTAPVFS